MELSDVDMFDISATGSAQVIVCRLAHTLVKLTRLGRECGEGVMVKVVVMLRKGGGGKGRCRFQHQPAW